MSALARLPLQRIAALSILGGVILLVWMMTVAPLWSAWERRAEQVDRTADLVAHLRQAAGESAALQAQIAKLAQSQHDRSAVIVAANPNLAGATLQAEVKRITEAYGGQLASIVQLPTSAQDAVNRIGVHVDLRADTPQLEKILYDLQAHNPILLVRNLSVRADERPVATPGQPSMPLNVQFDVIALTGTPQ